MVYRGCVLSQVIVVITIVVFLIAAPILNTFAWMPDMKSNFEIKYDGVYSDVFYGNRSNKDYFKLLDSNEDYLLLGARNVLYNISLDSLQENYEKRLEWPSSGAHREFCLIKGKDEDECQNYVQVLARLDNSRLLICGSNSYKPLCRQYTFEGGKYIAGADSDGIGQCPYNPEHNSTALYYNGQLYTATRSFAGEDSLIYRKPLRTERSDVKQLNAPNFVSSFGHGDFVYFFYRETAVEYINCGKAIYSRVARVCKDDKGGPHQLRDRWTSFLKARLNCSIPGDYPFYFDEIQATSDIIKGSYGSRVDELIYGVMTTPTNAIGGSAICAYSMRDIATAFEGDFKAQSEIDSNWLPVKADRVLHTCVEDSRVLPDTVVHFIKTHPLMEQAVPSYYAKPILVHVSLQYRFTAIAVDAQVQAVNGNTYDILYIGTDDGKLLKAVYTSNEETRNVHGIVISKSQVLPQGTAVTGLKVVSSKNKLIIVSKSQVRTVQLNHCMNITSCSACVKAQDPHCVWDLRADRCIRVSSSSVLTESSVQSVEDGDDSRCRLGGSIRTAQETTIARHKTIISATGEAENQKPGEHLTFDVLPADSPAIPLEVPVAVREGSVIYTAETLQIVLVAAILLALLFGFVAGYLCSRRFHPVPTIVDSAILEQHNHLNRFSNPNLNTSNRNSFLPHRANKAINLACNIPANKVLMKKDNNLGTSKELNNSIESIDKNTLQKVKKTYI